VGLVAIVEVIAQLAARQGNQIAASIDQKLGLGGILFLGEAME